MDWRISYVFMLEWTYASRVSRWDWKGFASMEEVIQGIGHIKLDYSRHFFVMLLFFSCVVLTGHGESGIESTQDWASLPTNRPFILGTFASTLPFSSLLFSFTL